VFARAQPGQLLNLPKEHKNDHDDENEAHSSRRDIAPLAAVRPPRHCPQKRQDQHHDQDSSKHCFLFPFLIQPSVLEHSSQQQLISLTTFPTGPSVPSITALDECLVQVEADGNAIARISAVVQIISVSVVVHVDVVAVVPIV
jgi:hypothetical protein